MIEVQSLTRHYGKTAAVDNVSFSIVKLTESGMARNGAEEGHETGFRCVG